MLDASISSSDVLKEVINGCKFASESEMFKQKEEIARRIEQRIMAQAGITQNIVKLCNEAAFQQYESSSCKFQDMVSKTSELLAVMKAIHDRHLVIRKSGLSSNL